ncbi:MAG: GNAT family N-acetyltransferase [Clostridia bacterium]|nr:GNAT family N-acetyltransferase [Clostridia bacterium]
MNHLGTQTIETKRLILRKYKDGEEKYVYKNWASDDEVTKYLTWQTHKDVSVSKEWIDFLKSNYDRKDFYEWTIVLKEIDEPIGSISVVELKENINAVHIGYCIGRKWWHQGITSEALSALIDFFFDKVGVDRIESRHDPRNVNSGKVMQKCGMKYEGTMRKADVNNQGICDCAYYAILKSDKG